MTTEDSPVRKFLRREQERKEARQRQDMEWKSHFVAELLDKIKAANAIRSDVQLGMKYAKFSPEAVPFLIRRLDKASESLFLAMVDLGFISEPSEPHSAPGDVTSHCPVCGTGIQQPATGARRVYCSSACRQAAYRQRHA